MLGFHCHGAPSGALSCQVSESINMLLLRSKDMSAKYIIALILLIRGFLTPWFFGGSFGEER